MDDASWIGRFLDLGPLGEGQMGVIRRVRDPELNRNMAMKILRKEHEHNDRTRGRFKQEAQATAQLQHPGIVAVHEIGRLKDGRPFYTMAEIHGRPLSEVIEEVHAAGGTFMGSGRLWSLGRLIDVFRQACEAVGYAHSRGVMHRDLKPENIMVGEHGEVVVVDWGLAKVLKGRADPHAPKLDAAYPTQLGSMLGTPMYMAPEQAQGELDAVGPHSDVYSLGVVLYEILAGHVPFDGEQVVMVLAQLLMGTVREMEGSLPVPEDLKEVCLRALSLDPEARFPDASALADAVAKCLEGTHRRRASERSLEQADALIARVAALRAEQAELHRQGQEALAALAPHQPAVARVPGWALLDQAQALDLPIAQQEAEALQLLQLTRLDNPDHSGVLGRLADLYCEAHRRAEAAGDLLAAQLAEAALAEVDQGRYAAYLKGSGRLSLQTSVPVEVRLLRRVSAGRRWIWSEALALGRTPIEGLAVPSGALCLELQAGEGTTTRCLVELPRSGSVELQVTLPVALQRHEVYVPAGWAILGEPGERRWVEGFIMEREPVSRAAYALFLRDLALNGREEELREHTPLGWTTERVRGQRWPATGMSWHSAKAYAAWLTATEGRPWRLPRVEEWEKAARGVDGRRFPWGDTFDASWCRMRQSQEGAPSLARLGTCPADESPYGVWGLGGNTRDWCAEGDEEARAVRGGAWDATAADCVCSRESFLPPSTRSPTLGLRLVRSFPPVGS